MDSLPVEPQEKPKNTVVGSLSLLQWIFLTQELNRGLLHCRRTLYLSYQGSPKHIKMLHNVHHQFSSVAQSCPTLCDPMNCSTPGLPVHHQLPGFTQTHVHRVSDAIQPSYPLLSPFSSCPQSLPASESFPMSQLFSKSVYFHGPTTTTHDECATPRVYKPPCWSALDSWVVVAGGPCCVAHRMYYGANRLGQAHLPCCPPHGAMGHGLNPDLFCTHAQAPGHVEGDGMGLRK